MNLLTLTTLSFFLFPESVEVEKPSSDVKREIINRYKGRQVEEDDIPTCHEESTETDDELI